MWAATILSTFAVRRARFRARATKKDGRTMSTPYLSNHSSSSTELVAHAEAIRALGRRAIADIIRIGEHLIDAKAIVGHGGWLAWLEREFGWAERTARNYMSAAELAAKSAMVADLDIDAGALYLLAARSTPLEVVADVAGLGRRIVHEDVASRIRRDDDYAQIMATRYGPVVEAEAERAVKVHYVSAPPEAPTVPVPYYVPADQPEPEVRTITFTYTREEAEDLATQRIRAAAGEVRWNIRAIADALAGHQIDAIIAAWDDDERERVRKGIEAVDKLKAALDAAPNVIRFPDKPN
jgi:hypothetical protein